jgi:hypothetical protein
MSPLDWSEMKKLASKGPDITTIKTELPIAYVLAVADIPISQSGDGKLHAVCPFHDDDDPSLDIGKQEDKSGQLFERFWCSPCKARGDYGEGDVLDLIQQLPQFNCDTIGDAKLVARDLLEQMHEEGWKGPQLMAPVEFDLETAYRVVGSEPDMAYLQEFVEAKAFPFDAHWLRHEFGVTTFNNWIVVPHREENQLVGYKHRSGADDSWSSAAGSSLKTHLYFEENDTDSRKPIFLSESETDVWNGHFQLGDTYAVLGLPAGAGTRPDTLVDRLAKRKVVVAFDGDSAGRSANRRWWAALTARGCSVKVLPLADGTDIGSTTDLNELVKQARSVPDAPMDIRIEARVGGYVRVGKKDALDQITNWYFEPERELRGPEGTAYEGILMPQGTRTVITSQDLRNKGSATSWAIDHHCAWYGSDRDAQQILGLLQHEGPFLATGEYVTVAGLYKGQFVFPGGRIGHDYLVYLPPNNDPGLEDRLKIEDLDWNIQQLLVMRRLHKRVVMDPILAWLAAVPLRPMFREFPVLSILAGNAGLGKTTLTETVVKAFTSTQVFETLMNSSKFGMSNIATGMSSFVLWEDEYKKEAGEKNLGDAQQLVREAYNGKGGSKGGMKSSGWMKNTRMPITAPIIISGEESFVEVSITERSVTVVLPVGGRNPEALGQVQSWGDTGFAYNYLKFLYEGLSKGTLPEIRNFLAGPEDLPPRARANIGVLYLGWELLVLFLRSQGIDPSKTGFDTPNFSLVIQEAKDAATTNPYRDAVLWSVSQSKAYEFSKRDGDRLVLQIENFMQFVLNNSSMGFPGGRKAVERSLKALYGATEAMVVIDGREKQCMEMSWQRVFDDVRETGDEDNEW